MCNKETQNFCNKEDKRVNVRKIILKAVCILGVSLKIYDLRITISCKEKKINKKRLENIYKNKTNIKQKNHHL